jgi:DNA-binding SARP family transcriptional activator
MDFRVLGPLQVWTDGAEVPVAGRQRALLALLLIAGEQVVSAERLVDELWGERPPPSAANMLQGSVSRLRKVLEGDGSLGRKIVSRVPGYALQVADDQVDARRFEALVRDGERLLAAGDLGGADVAFGAGLALWRGPAFADVPHSNLVANEAARLEELRLVATELRIEAELGLGRDGSVVPELEALVGEHPYRERLRGELMLALYRVGRQPDALEVYREGRRRLVEELGIEPGPRLQQLERAILEQAPALDAPNERPNWRRAPRTRRRLLGVAVLLALASALAGFAILRGGESAAPAAVPVKAHSVAAIDPASNRVVASREVGGWPRAIAGGDGFVWVARAGDDSVLRIDPVSKLVLDSFFATTPLDVAWSDGALWIANGNTFDGPNPPGGGTVERWDLERQALVRGRVGPAVPGNGEQTTVAAGKDGVWAGNADEARVYRLDRHVGGVAATVPTTIQVAGLAVGLGSVWAADPINDTVFRIDPRTARVVARIPLADGPRRLAVGEGAVWVVGEFPRSGVWRIDPATNRAVAHIRVPRRANWVAVGEGSVWVTSNTPGHAGPGSLSRIDPQANAVSATIELGFSPEDVVVANGLVWVVVGPM